MFFSKRPRYCSPKSVTNWRKVLTTLPPGDLLPSQVQHPQGRHRGRDEEGGHQPQEGGAGGVRQQRLRQIPKVPLGSGVNIIKLFTAVISGYSY